MLPVLYDQEYGKWKWHDRAPKWHTTTRRFMVNYHLQVVKEGEANGDSTWCNHSTIVSNFGREEDSHKYAWFFDATLGSKHEACGLHADNFFQ